jgi:V/A-type H+-transporting ATPase subunit K
MTLILTLAAGLIPMIPAIVFFIRRKANGDAQAASTRGLVLSLSTVNVLLGFMILGVGLTWFFAPDVVQAAGLAQAEAVDPYASLAAAIAVSAGSLGAAYAVSTTGSAAVGAIAEKPELFGRALIFVGLAEGVAIYGLIIAFIILNR